MKISSQVQLAFLLLGLAISGPAFGQTADGSQGQRASEELVYYFDEDIVRRATGTQDSKFEKNEPKQRPDQGLGDALVDALSKPKFIVTYGDYQIIAEMRCQSDGSKCTGLRLIAPLAKVPTEQMADAIRTANSINVNEPLLKASFEGDRVWILSRYIIVDHGRTFKSIQTEAQTFIQRVLGIRRQSSN